MLHTLNKSTGDWLTPCLRYGRPNDALVLLEDGVYWALTHTADKVDKLLEKGIRVYAIDLDINARGLADRLNNAVTVIGYDEFVELSVAHPTSKRW